MILLSRFFLISSFLVGVAEGYKLTEDQDLDRVHVVDGDEPRLPLCKPSQVKNQTASRCILSPPPPPYIRGHGCEVIKRNLFTDSVDALALSQVIYEVVELREAARANKTNGGDLRIYESLRASLEDPLSYAEMLDMLQGNIDLM